MHAVYWSSLGRLGELMAVMLDSLTFLYFAVDRPQPMSQRPPRNPIQAGSDILAISLSGFDPGYEQCYWAPTF